MLEAYAKKCHYQAFSVYRMGVLEGDELCPGSGLSVLDHHHIWCNLELETGARGPQARHAHGLVGATAAQRLPQAIQLPSLRCEVCAQAGVFAMYDAPWNNQKHENHMLAKPLKTT